MIAYKRFFILMATLITSVNPMVPSCEERESFFNEVLISLNEWSRGSQEFTAAFYPHIKKKESNFLYSPLSLQITLAIASEIAYGETQSEIIDKGFLPRDSARRQLWARELMKRFNTGLDRSMEFFSLSLVNGIWISSEMAFKQESEKSLLDFYGAAFNLADFNLSAEEARKEINNWVEENTHSNIQGFLSKGALDRHTKLVLVNTLFMRAPWEDSFDLSSSYEDSFFGKKKVSSTVFMRKLKEFNVLNEAQYTVVELPFKKSVQRETELSLYVILPFAGVDLDEIECLMTPEILNHWIQDGNPCLVDLSLPKFKISSSLNAKNALKKMNLKRPFSEFAEFELENSTQSFCISDVFHNTTLEINETGGVGSAATGVILSKRSLKESNPRLFIKVNRPFLVIVADKASKIILFTGRIMNPKSLSH